MFNTSELAEQNELFDNEFDIESNENDYDLEWFDSDYFNIPESENEF